MSPKKKYIIIADECVGADWVRFLREYKYSVISFGEGRRKGRTDDEVLNEAIKRHGILITGDADFAERAARKVATIHIKPRSIQQNAGARDALLTILTKIISGQELSRGPFLI